MVRRNPKLFTRCRLAKQFMKLIFFFFFFNRDDFYLSSFFPTSAFPRRKRFSQSGLDIFLIHTRLYMVIGGIFFSLFFRIHSKTKLKTRSVRWHIYYLYGTTTFLVVSRFPLDVRHFSSELRIIQQEKRNVVQLSYRVTNKITLGNTFAKQNSNFLNAAFNLH